MISWLDQSIIAGGSFRWIDAALIVAAIAAAVVIHILAFAGLRRLSKETITRSDDIFVGAGRAPLRWVFIAIALALVRNLLRLSRDADFYWTQAASFIIPLLVGWLAIALISALNRAVQSSAKASGIDDLHVRQRRTQTVILTKIGAILVGFVTVCLMLLAIPGVRTVGVTLMASAGILGIAVGAAAQPALKNIIAGIQMAFTEPIRLDDSVVIDGELGRIEEIRLTYVVVAIWDERRLVVPVSRFLEQTFQNWTRVSEALWGSVSVWLDPTADIARLRAKYIAFVQANPNYDGRGYSFQVTETTPTAIEVRGTATAKDSGSAYNLRCALREALLAYVRDEMPEALPRGRYQVGHDHPLALAAADQPPNQPA